MVKYIFYFSTVLCLLVLNSCADEPDPRIEEESFTKIYDNSAFDASIIPIDIKQTADGGYMILADRELLTSDFGGIYLLKVDNKGNFEREIVVGDSLVHPVGNLIKDQDDYYFFCMNKNTVGVTLIKLNETLETVESTPVPFFYPMAAAKNSGGGFILLSYDNDERKSILSLINTSGNPTNSVGVEIGIGDNDDIDERIVNHFIRKSARHYPFQVGQISGGAYWFNGFENYTFSLVFTTFDADDPIDGAVNGQQDDGGFNYLLPINGSNFASAWFNFNDVYLLPSNSFNPTNPNAQITSLESESYTLPEIVRDAKIKIISTVIDEQNILIYGSDTRAKQIGLYFYTQGTGEFIGSKYLGFSNPFEMSSMVVTEDEGLAVCGITYLAGRFPRICLFKLSKDELAEIVK